MPCGDRAFTPTTSRGRTVLWRRARPDVGARRTAGTSSSRSATADVLLVFRPEATLQGDPLPAHGAQGPGISRWASHARTWTPGGTGCVEHGVEIEHEESWPHGGHSLYFRDPAGNSVELITPGVWGLPSGW